ncbi:MAG: von Willebrand factor type A domain-containing protein [Flavisolibacter sp.]|nr:von Willebrand factor type A domain-containing protein [Flavisolibacter sp.]
MKHFVNIVILVLSPLLLFSQYYLRGQVKDEAGNILQNAAIYLHSTGYYYYSTTEGTFTITNEQRVDTVTVSHDGYIRQKFTIDANSFADIRLKRSAFSKNTSVNKLVSLTENLKRESQQQWFTGDETYASLVENQFINATAYPTTGLTLNIDKASYSNIRRFLSIGSPVPPDAVRIEEMLNYFNFDYQEPPNNKTFDIKATLTECPWNKTNQLLFAQITSKKLKLDSLPQTHLVFLIDVSGSMDMPNRLPVLKEGFKSLAKNLRPQDSVSIVVYGGTVGVILPTTGGNEKDTILKTIDSLQPGGSTPGESGIKLAYSVARNHFIKNGNNRIILATDGDFNVGLKTDEELDDMITLQRQNGIYLTCLGIGMGNYKDSKIQTLAKKGHGNFAYIDSYAEAEKVLLTEYMQTLYTVADDAYLDVQFNSDFVKQYRVIGFDNKVGAIKDVQATIEGGDIGSGYSTLIAFEITPTQSLKWVNDNKYPVTPVSFNLKYRIPSDTSQVLRLNETPEIFFKTFKDLPRYHQFASAVVMFGSLLRKSRFVKDVSWNEVQEIATASAASDNFSQKEFVTLVQKAKIIYGKSKTKKRKRSD